MKNKLLIGTVVAFGIAAAIGMFTITFGAIALTEVILVGVWIYLVWTVRKKKANIFHDQICLVVLNMSEQTHRLSFDLPCSSAHVLFSSHNRDSDTDNVDMLSVAPFETYIAELR